MKSDSRTARRQPCRPPCWTKASISVRLAPCTASSNRQGESRERRDQLVHPAYQKPELLATAPNQLWSWDITKLLGPAKWTYFYLYVILDVFSRYVVGWMVAHSGERGTGQAVHRGDHSASTRFPPANSPSTPTAAGS